VSPEKVESLVPREGLPVRIQGSNEWRPRPAQGQIIPVPTTLHGATTHKTTTLKASNLPYASFLIFMPSL